MDRRKHTQKLAMAGHNLLRVILLLSAAAAALKPEAPEPVQKACKATQLPQLCESSLGNVPESAKPADLISAAMGVALRQAAKAEGDSKTLLLQKSNANITAAARNCVEFAEAAQQLIQKSASPKEPSSIADSQAWMSAALAYLYDCSSDLRYVNTTASVERAISTLDLATNYSSNALSMLFSLVNFGQDMSVWGPPVTERQRPLNRPLVSPREFDVLDALDNVGREFVPNVTVSKNGPGSLRSIQEAVNRAPDWSPTRYVIRIGEGVYDETVRVPRSKTNLVFLGAGIDKTVVTGSQYVPSLPAPVTIYDVATVGVDGDGFMAMDMSFENSFRGPKTHQAVALRVDSDKSSFYRCAMRGHQDTLYAHTLRQYYHACHIEGTHDFIFGNAAAFFYKCSISIQPRLDPDSIKSGDKDPVTAQGRTDPAETTGFVFYGCNVNGNPAYMKDFRRNPKIHMVFLGRPWKMYSRTVFIKSFLGEVVRGEGWMPWNGTFALSTLFYGEFENYGPGAADDRRVSWSTRIGANELGLYSVRNFIEGDRWLPMPASSAPTGGHVP